jgi:hypothetical protein
MNRIRLLIGFFVPTLGSAALDHLLKRTDPGEILDSMLVAVVFTAVFALGVRLGQDGGGHVAEPGGFRTGFAAGLTVQLVVWGFWLSVPHDARYSFGSWPLLGHMILMVTAGYTLSRLRRSRVSGA